MNSTSPYWHRVTTADGRHFNFRTLDSAREFERKTAGALYAGTVHYSKLNLPAFLTK